MIIRLIVKEDLPACGEIYAAAFDAAPYFGTWTQASAAEMLSGLLERDPESCWCITQEMGTVPSEARGLSPFLAAASADGPHSAESSHEGIVGFAFCTTYGIFRGTVQELAIAPRFQKRGLGKRLLEHILIEFQARGIKNIDLVTNIDAPAHDFYRKYKFRRPERYVVMARPL